MRPSVLLCAALLVLAPGAARGDWMSEYDRGLRALRAGQHAQAEAHFRAAIREKRDPVVRQRFQGSRYEPYVPQHHAAMAAWQRGDCAAALEYWQQAGLDAVLARLPDLQAEQSRGIAACGSPPAVAAASPPPATPASDASTAPPPGEPLRAESPVATAPPPPPRASPAPPAATPVAVRPPAATPAAPAAARAPDVLVAAIDAWLGGRYTDLQRVDPTATADAATRAQLLLLRAAARFVLAELDGSDAAALDAVRSDVRAAKAANAALSPDAGMFPPRFRLLWQQTR